MVFGVALCGEAMPCITSERRSITHETLALATNADTGDNPLELQQGANENRSIEGIPHARVWFSTTVIHYTGNGLWTVGFAPHPTRSIKDARWQWVHDLSTKQAQETLAENRRSIVRCTTEEVRQILRGCP